ncbi:MAG: DMT family transporter [Deltaproteobacteria bacterium]|nr:DMT family transporter [Deltaproteobacteria bacterium]
MTRNVRLAMVLGSALLFAFVAPGVRLLDGSVSGLDIAGLRGLFAAALLGIVWVVLCRSEREPLVLRREVMIAAFFVAASSFLSIYALSLQKTATAASLLYGAPVYALVLNPFLGKRTTWIEAMAASGTGVALFVLLQEEGGWTLPGVIVGIFSGVALVLVGYRFHAMSRATDKVLALSLGSAAQAVLIPFGATTIGSISGSEWLILAGIGLFTSAIPNLLLGLSLSDKESLIGQTIALAFEPFFQVGLAYLIVKEIPGWYGFFGCALHILVVASYRIATLPRPVSARAATA